MQHLQRWHTFAIHLIFTDSVYCGSRHSGLLDFEYSGRGPVPARSTARFRIIERIGPRIVFIV